MSGSPSFVTRKHPVRFTSRVFRQDASSNFLNGSVTLKSKKVLIIDDVLTAGTAIKNSLKIIKKEKAYLTAVMVALDREEKDENNNFYRDNLNKEGIKIFSIAKISELT